MSKALPDLNKLYPVVIYAPSDEPVPYAEEPTKAKLWARYAWFSGKYTNKEIALAVDVDISVIARWVRGTQKTAGWSEEKESADKRIINRVVQTNVARINGTLSRMLDALELSANAIIENREMLTVAEFNQYVTAFEKLFKTRQLEMGRPTEILADGDGKEITWTDIKKRMEEVDILDYKAASKIGIDGK